MMPTKLAFDPEELCREIAEVIAKEVKSYNVPAICVRFSIQETVDEADSHEAHSSKRSYVKARLPDLLHRRAAHDFGPGLIAGQHGSGGEFGGDGAGCDGVDANAFVGERQRHSAGQLVDAALAYVVAGNRGDGQHGVD